MREYGPKRIVVNESQKNVMPLSESSLNKMMDHGKTGMVIISSQVSQIDRTDPNLSLRPAFERDMKKKWGGMETIDSDALYDEEQAWLRKRNAAAEKELHQDIQKAGFSYTPVYGGYRMKETGEESHEPSYVVYAYTRSGEPVDFKYLEKFALGMCKKYKQESVYVQAPGDPPQYLDYNGNQVNSSSSDNFKYNREDQEFFTTTKRDKAGKQRFTADIVFENMYIQLRPGDYNERMRRWSSGEYIL